MRTASARGVYTPSGARRDSSLMQWYVCFISLGGYNGQFSALAVVLLLTSTEVQAMTIPSTLRLDRLCNEAGSAAK